MKQLELFDISDSSLDAAKTLIRPYVKRGDTIESLKAGLMGIGVPQGMSAQIGGYIDPFEKNGPNKHYTPDHILVFRDMNGVDVNRVYSLRKVYDLIASE